METLNPVEQAVLGMTAHGPESLEAIYRHLHEEPHPVPLAEAADAVRSLVDRGLLAARPPGEAPLPDDASLIWKARFEPTSRAQSFLAEGLSPTPSDRPRRRVYAGMLRGLIPETPFEVFKENRREMSGRYSEANPDE